MQRNPRKKWIRECLFGIQILVIGLVSLCRIYELSQHGEASAGAANRPAGPNVFVEGLLYRRALPEIDVARLIATSNKNGFCLANRVCNLRFSGSFAARDDHGCNGVRMA